MDVGAGLYMYDVVVKKIHVHYLISDEFLLFVGIKQIHEKAIYYKVN